MGRIGPGVWLTEADQGPLKNKECVDDGGAFR